MVAVAVVAVHKQVVVAVAVHKQVAFVIYMVVHLYVLKIMVLFYLSRLFGLC
jgi:hypothetical protein